MSEFEKFSLPREIVGEKVILRQRVHQYDESLWKLIDSSRDFLRPYLFWVDKTQSIDNVREITDLFMQKFDEQQSFEYVFLDKATEQLVGAGGLHTIHYDHHSGEFGYYLDKNAVGNGYVTEVVSLLSEQAFTHGIHRLVIICDRENTASAAVAERCGFQFEGIEREARYVYGEYRDIAVYAKLNGKG